MRISGVFEDPALPRVLETGMVVTYARIFLDGDGYSPIPLDWIPAEYRQLHRLLLERRRRYDAHTDIIESHAHRRQVTSDEEWLMIGFPDPLPHEQLKELADLTSKLRTIVAERMGGSE